LGREPVGQYIYLGQEGKISYKAVKKEGYFPLQDKKILDVGCNRGDFLVRLTEYGARENNLYGVDLLPERIEEGRRKYPCIVLQCANAEHLNYPDGFFDLIFFFTVFSSVLDDSMARKLAREAMRVSRPGSLIVIYDIRWRSILNQNLRSISKKTSLLF